MTKIFFKITFALYCHLRLFKNRIKIIVNKVTYDRKTKGHLCSWRLCKENCIWNARTSNVVMVYRYLERKNDIYVEIFELLKKGWIVFTVLLLWHLRYMALWNRRPELPELIFFFFPIGPRCVLRMYCVFTIIILLLYIS